MFTKNFFKRNDNSQALRDAMSLLREAKNLAYTVNTTISEDIFYTSYEKLITTLKELTKYEKIVPFSNRPSKDLKNVIKNRDAATNRFLERQNEAYQKLHVKEMQSRQLEEKSIQIVAPNKNSHSAEEIDFSYIDIENPSTFNKNIDPYFCASAYFLINKGKASIGMLQRYFKLGFNRAAHIMDQLEEFGIVGPDEGSKPRKVLVTSETFDCMLTNVDFSEIIEQKAYASTNSSLLSEERLSFYNGIFDYMTGDDFEHFCADILKKNNFENVEVTQGSGDHGIDILAEKDGITYAIQCKCYSSNIGNAAVQQAHTGKSLYHRDIAVVITNQYFTAQAKEEAAALGVKLWDRDKLNELIEKSSLNTQEKGKKL